MCGTERGVCGPRQAMVSVAGATLAAVARDWLAYASAVRAFSSGGATLSEDEGALFVHLLGQPALRRRARLQAFAQAALALRLWHRPHYRAASFCADARANLRNVALPGTGLPLSAFCASRALAALFVTHGLPLACLLEALRRRLLAVLWGNGLGGFGSLLAADFRQFLLLPDDWCTLWRLNCNLASWHALLTEDVGYALEDKLAFLQAAEAAGVPVSPSIDAPRVVVKHRNEEGGLGFRSFVNARHGGDWIVQPWLRNAKQVAALLPAGAPLSTVRVITASENGLHPDGEAPRPRALSCVWRAGRCGAETDHTSVLFDVDLDSAKIVAGTSNMHWYRLGIGGLTLASPTEELPFFEHPDTGRDLRGAELEGLRGARELVERAHARLLPGVPLVGWDVAMTHEAGTCLLEVNLSCNFFKGRYGCVLDSVACVRTILAQKPGVWRSLTSTCGRKRTLGDLVSHCT